MITLNVVHNADQVESYQFDQSQTITIGRSDTNAVALAGRRVSRQHCKIQYSDDAWVLQDLGSQNGTRLNGHKVDSAPLANGDVVQLAGYQIEIVLPPPEKPSVDEDATLVIADDDQTQVAMPDETVVFQRADDTADRPKSAGLKTKFAGMPLPKKIIFGLLAFFVLMVVFKLVTMIMVPDAETPPQEDLVAQEEQKTKAIQDLELKHKIESHLKSGQALMEEGDCTRALTRFQAVLAIDPENQQAVQLAAQCQTELERAERAAQLEAEQAEKNRQRVQTLLSEAATMTAKGSYAQALKLLTEAKHLAPQSEEVAQAVEEVTTKLKSEVARIEAQARARQQALEKLKATYAIAVQAHAQGRLRQALDGFKAVLALNLGGAETTRAREMVPELERQLKQQATEAYKKGLELHDAKAYTKAMLTLRTAVAYWPQFPEARSELQEITAFLEEQARVLYQEGVVYEGIGQNKKARRKWQAVLEVMPLPTNTYHQKARQKLGL